jgi:hypothetical protein
MKKYMFRNTIGLSMLVVFMALGIGEVFANNANADLEVEIRGRNNPFVYSPYQYRVQVRNNGTVDAQNVRVAVDFTLTDTSPTQQVLGRLTFTDNRCQFVSNILECDIGRVKAGRGKNVKFDFVFPVSTKTIEFLASVTTDTPEITTNNNSATKSPNFRYLSNSITSADVINYHCTGQNLTSFYECTISPTSTTSHPTRLESNGTITFNVPGYTGSWYQPTASELHFTYSANNTVVADFKGYAISATCFEGLTTFPNSNYVSPYRVCIQ